MDMHDMDEYLDLQDQNNVNLLATEMTTQPETVEEEWHAAPLSANAFIYNGQSDWDLLQNVELQQQLSGTMMMHEGCITPDLLKQPPPPPPVEETRITRSKASGQTVTTTPKKPKKTRAKKLYCLCQQPYNGKPMVQCDVCQEWYHCACVNFDPSEEDTEESVDWACQQCKEEKDTTKEPDTIEESVTTNDTTKEPVSTPTTTRQTRTRHQSQCLYAGCTNFTRADSYCSDVCARRDQEGETKPTRKSRMQTAANSAARKKSITPPADQDYKQEEEEVDDDNETAGTGSSTPNTPMSPSQMTEQANPIRRNVIKNMSAILKSIIDTALVENEHLFQDEMEPPVRAELLAKSIENTMLEQLGDVVGKQRNKTCGELYKSKFRSLLYNLKDKQNKVFQIRVITGDLSPSELVSMSSEDMANPELKSMSEVLRKTALKNTVMKLDNTPIIKKTHKGDIIMVPNKDNDTSQNLYSEQVQNQHKAATLKSPEEEKKPWVSSFSPTTTTDGNKVDPLDDILARIGIPQGDENQKRGSIADSDTSSNTTKKRKVTLDMEALLGHDEEEYKVDEVPVVEEKAIEEEEEEEYDPETTVLDDAEPKLPSIWQGHVNMPQVAEFEASARQIGGRILTQSEWTDILSPTMWIEGRIPSERVTSYVTQTQYSTSREIILLEIEPSEQVQSQTLLKYLDSRKRYAVVGHNKTQVKDFYLIPLYKTQHIPDSLYVVRVEETKREVDLFLGVLVLLKQQPKQVVSPPPPPPSQPYVPSYGQAPSQYGYGYQSYNSNTNNSQYHSSNQQYRPSY